MITITTESAWLFFVAMWWVSVTFHMAVYMPMWLTKAGNWTKIWMD